MNPRPPIPYEVGSPGTGAKFSHKVVGEAMSMITESRLLPLETVSVLKPFTIKILVKGSKAKKF
jgi:hypothetical protein